MPELLYKSILRERKIKRNKKHEINSYREPGKRIERSGGIGGLLMRRAKLKEDIMVKVLLKI